MINLPLNKKEADNHFNKVKDFIQNRIGRVLNLGYINKGRNPVVRINVSQDLRTYLESLLDNNDLNALINLSPENYSGYVSFIQSYYSAFFNEESNENKILRNIFIAHCYDKNECFNKLEFIKQINIDTCPYCNRNYIYYLSNSYHIKPEIDHFYPKSKYPFFAASFYNLIPSCQTCNGLSAKSNHDPVDVDIINPYLIRNNDFKFTYEIKSIKFLHSLKNKHSIKVKFCRKIDGHITIFKLDKLYEQHSDHVSELIVKSKVAYSQEYRKKLKGFKGFEFNDNEIDQMILGNFSRIEDQHKRPLSKMYQDIGKELGLID